MLYLIFSIIVALFMGTIVIV
ncbi:cytochrome C biogenesis protein CcdC, partial [Staphylococcus aureus]